MSNVIDLWPAEISADVELTGPAVILKEQAALLGEKTKNLVKAEVKSYRGRAKDEFIEHFFLVGPIIDYRFQLFSVNYPLEFYPAAIFFSEWQNGRQVDDEIALTQQLMEIFSHRKTVAIINAIIARSKAEDPFADE